MKEIKINHGRIEFEGNNGQPIVLNPKDRYKQKKEAALKQGTDFFITHSAQILDLLSGGVSEEITVFQEEDFRPMVESLSSARISRLDFFKRIRSVLSASPQKPPEALINPLVYNFTEFVWEEKRRVSIERKTKLTTG